LTRSKAGAVPWCSRTGRRGQQHPSVGKSRRRNVSATSAVWRPQLLFAHLWPTHRRSGMSFVQADQSVGVGRTVSCAASASAFVAMSQAISLAAVLRLACESSHTRHWYVRQVLIFCCWLLSSSAVSQLAVRIRTACGPCTAQASVHTCCCLHEHSMNSCLCILQ
jgi:hypothetical protein